MSTFSSVKLSTLEYKNRKSINNSNWYHLCRLLAYFSSIDTLPLLQLRDQACYHLPAWTWVDTHRHIRTQQLHIHTSSWPTCFVHIMYFPILSSNTNGTSKSSTLTLGTHSLPGKIPVPQLYPYCVIYLTGVVIIGPWFVDIFGGQYRQLRYRSCRSRNSAYSAYSAYSTATPVRGRHSVRTKPVTWLQYCCRQQTLWCSRRPWQQP